MRFLVTICSLIVSFVIAVVAPVQAASPRPNIVWLSAEDINSHFGCFGDPHAHTPHLDQLAKEGVRYSNAFTTAGVCAPCRSGIITGMYQTTLGTQHMRSQARLPSSVRPFTTYLRQAGYYCTNASKQDYQFSTPSGTWDDSSGKAHWRKRKSEDQPFFSVFNFGGCHESGIASAGKYKSVTAKLPDSFRQDPAKLTTLPPYYPDTEVTREDWKRNYELISAMDAWAGNLIDQLKEDGLYENTIIFYWSDHGVGLPRAKRWLYDSGTHIPLIVRAPAQFKIAGMLAAGSANDRMVSSIDFSATVLQLAGVDLPAAMQGQPFLGDAQREPRDFVYGARDRMDERYDIIRMVRDKRYKYIRNYEPLKTYYQYMNTPEKGATMRELRRLHEAGQLGPVAEHYFSPAKSVEELYDTQADPHEINNLAASPDHQKILQRLRAAHLKWVRDTKDLGLIAEPILVAREAAIGHRYGILRQKGSESEYGKVAETAVAASAGTEAMQQLLTALDDPSDAVRYWAATGLGNIGLPAKPAAARLKERLGDESAVVRVAAARALCRLKQPAPALPVLAEVLDDGAQWERLHAAIVLDEIDEQARPVMDEMKAALKPRTKLYAGGKYTVRVINRALNQLLGTNNAVR